MRTRDPNRCRTRQGPSFARIAGDPWLSCFGFFMSLIERTAAELLALQAKGDATAEAITDAFLAAIRDRDPKVKAFLHVDEAGARAGPGRRSQTQARASRSANSPACRSPSRTCCAPRASPTTCGSKILQELRAALRRPRHRATQGRRRRPDRQDEHGRVRHGLVHREQRLSGNAQSLGPGAHPRRLVSGGSAAAVAACEAPLVARHRHRRLDPPAGRACAASSA